MLSYRVILDVPLPLVVFVSGLPAAHRREPGTRDGMRALTCRKQAVFTLAAVSGLDTFNPRHALEMKEITNTPDHTDATQESEIKINN